MRDSRNIIILTIVCIFIFFYGLGNMALTDPDETFYAETAKEMLKANEWITPLIFGKPQFEKPILYYWLVELSFKFFGVNEFAARFPSALFGIIGCLAIYFIGRILFSSLSGLIASLFTATCTQYIIITRACVTDVVLTAFITLCFLFFLLGLEKENKLFYIISAVMAALAVLTKGPIGVFIPAVIIGLYMIFTRQWEAFKKIPFILSILVFLAISLPWYIIVFKLHGSAFTSEFFGLHNIIRFLEPEHRIGSSPFFYIPAILGGFLPWTPFLIFGTWYMVKSEVGESAIKAPRLFLALWFFFIFLFFSASSTKLVTYVFPLFPVLSIVIGRFWERFLENDQDIHLRRLMNYSYVLFALVCVLAFVGGYFVIQTVYPQVLKGALIASVFFIAFAGISIVLYVRKKFLVSFYILILSGAISIVPIVAFVLPVIEEFETSKAISYKLKELAGKDEAIGGECDHRRGIAFYSDRVNVADIHSYNDLISFLSSEKRVWGVIQKKHYQQIKENKPELVSEPLFEAGDYIIISNESAEVR